MKTFSLALASSAIAVGMLSYSSTAHAIGPVDIEIGARVGYATNPSSDFSSNPFGFGFGGRAGVAIFGIYAGVSGMYYLGTSDAVGTSLHTAMEGFEVGYTLPIPVIKIRPQIGLGNATIGGGLSGSFSNLYLEPGVLVMIPVGIVFFGVDGNALLLPGATIPALVDGPATSSKTYVSFSAHGQFGLRF